MVRGCHAYMIGSTPELLSHEVQPETFSSY